MLGYSEQLVVCQSKLLPAVSAVLVINLSALNIASVPLLPLIQATVGSSICVH